MHVDVCNIYIYKSTLCMYSELNSLMSAICDWISDRTPSCQTFDSFDSRYSDETGDQNENDKVAG